MIVPAVFDCFGCAYLEIIFLPKALPIFLNKQHSNHQPPILLMMDNDRTTTTTTTTSTRTTAVRDDTLQLVLLS